MKNIVTAAKRTTANLPSLFLLRYWWRTLTCTDIHATICSTMRHPHPTATKRSSLLPFIRYPPRSGSTFNSLIPERTGYRLKSTSAK